MRAFILKIIAHLHTICIFARPPIPPYLTPSVTCSGRSSLSNGQSLGRNGRSLAKANRGRNAGLLVGGDGLIPSHQNACEESGLPSIERGMKADRIEQWADRPSCCPLLSRGFSLAPIKTDVLVS
ncbi:hypothetical protein AVEN_207445-1 [Araneus ventricosus]|uniref:Uncharacterized protein n=1 Tax=Araneus ventricosus TaxID=182803 RepID=A0A4Y2EBH6_ARAVE|nr:hypothetical protein AVEN_207445-1 [Araneus ventricosus]